MVTNLTHETAKRVNQLQHENTSNPKRTKTQPQPPIYQDSHDLFNQPSFAPRHSAVESLGDPGDAYALGTFDVSMHALHRLAKGQTHLQMDGLLYVDSTCREYIKTAQANVDHLVVGNQLGEGASARAFNHPNIPDIPSHLVVKIEQKTRTDPEIVPLPGLSARPGELVSADSDRREGTLNAEQTEQYEIELTKFQNEVATHLYVSHMAHHDGLGDEITPRLRAAWFTVIRADADQPGTALGLNPNDTYPKSELIFSTYTLMDRFDSGLNTLIEQKGGNVIHVMPQMARTLSFLRAIKVIHHDSSSHNWGVLMVNHHIRLWIIDWGQSIVYGKDDQPLPMYTHSQAFWPRILIKHPGYKYVLHFDGRIDMITTLKFLVANQSLAYPTIDRATAVELLTPALVNQDEIAHMRPPVLKRPVVSIPDNASFIDDLLSEYM